MPLSIGSAGSAKPYAKFNAKADKWFVRGLDGADLEIQRPSFVADFANIATGWLRLREGQAPERVMDPSIERAAPSPGEGFKRGFVVMTFSPKFFAGAAEFASASAHLSNAIKEVYAQYEAGKAEHPGMLPVIACTGAQAMKDRYGTNYKPTLQIVQWVPRPAELPDRSAIEPAEVWQGAAPAPREPAQHVAPPAAKPAADPLSQSVF